MPYNPGIQDISGQLLAQGMQARAQGIAGGVTTLFQGLQQNQMMTNQAIARFQAATAANPKLLDFLNKAGSEESPIPVNPDVIKAYSDIKSGKTNVQNTALLAQFADSYNQAEMAQQQQMLRQAQTQLMQAQAQKAQADVAEAERARAFMEQIGQGGGVQAGGMPSADVLSSLAQSGGGLPSGMKQQRVSPLTAAATQETGAVTQVPSAESAGTSIGLLPRQDQRALVPPTIENAMFIARVMNQGRPPTGAQVNDVFSGLNRQYEAYVQGPKLDQREKAYAVLESEFVQKNQRQPNAEERADLLRDASMVGTAGYSEGLAMMNPDGSFAGFSFFDKKSGKTMLRNEAGEAVDIPKGVTPATATSFTRQILPIEKVQSIKKEITDDEIALKRYSTYIKTVGNTNQGIERLADQITGRFSTLFGKGDLKREQVAQQLAQGQLQALVGASRLSTVGGGVMTEQDAIRVIQRLGGDVDALQNKEIVKRAIADMYSEKYAQYENALEFYNNSVRDYYGSRGYRPAAKLDFDPTMRQTSLELFGASEETPMTPQQQLSAMQQRLAELRAKQGK